MIYLDEIKWLNSYDARLSSDQQINNTPVTPSHPPHSPSPHHHNYHSTPRLHPLNAGKREVCRGIYYFLLSAQEHRFRVFILLSLFI